VKQMALVWEHTWETGEQLVMLSLADHAHHDSTEIRPSNELTAHKTGYSKRHVRRLIGGLKDKGILELQREATPTRPTTYRINWDNATGKDSYVPPNDDFPAGGDKMSSEPSGGTPMSPEPSYKEEKESTKEKEEREPETNLDPLRLNLSEDEAEWAWNHVLETYPHSMMLQTLRLMLDEQKKTKGAAAITRVWRELGYRYHWQRQNLDLSEDAWAYGFDKAIDAEAPNMGYVRKAAEGYRPHPNSNGYPGAKSWAKNMSIGSRHKREYHNRES
jgi:hypothetical protein